MGFEQHRKPAFGSPGAASGFSLIELLAVMGVIVILAGMVTGGAMYASRKAYTSRTQAMIQKLNLAIEAYHEDMGAYPHDADSSGGKRVDPAEALYIYLYDYPVQSRREPYLTFEDRELEDYDEDGLYEVVDAWGRPLLYKRIYGFKNSGFAKNFAKDFHHPVGVAKTSDRTDIPWHNQESFDLFSLGQNANTLRSAKATSGGTGNYVFPVDDAWGQALKDLKGGGTPSPYYKKALATPYGGEDIDDVNNWR
jgi:prepilin-type N-terminal cleavage/methylation domain-containing protein